MPLYEYYCQNCEVVFDDMNSIDNRFLPEDDFCSECNKKTIKLGLSVTSIGDPIRMGITKPSAEFKDVLQKIHERVGRGSRLDKKMSQHVERKRTL